MLRGVLEDYMKKELDKRKNLRVVTSNNFLRAAGLEGISLKARKLLYIAISQCRRADHEFYEYTISARDFASMMGVKAQGVYQTADTITDELMSGFLKLKTDTGIKKFQLFKSCEYVEDSSGKHNGLIHFQLSEDMTPYLLSLKKDFSKPLLQDFLQMKSTYSIEVWHLMQREMHSTYPGVDKAIYFYISLDELRKATGTEGKKGLQKLSNFKARVLDTAIAEIRELGLADITYTNRKSGRKVIGFNFLAKNAVSVVEDDLSDRGKKMARKAVLVAKKASGSITQDEEDEYERIKQELYE